MAYDYLPATIVALYGPAALSSQVYADQHWWALAERIQAAGNNAPFKQNHEYDTFHVDSIADNGDGTYTITDATKNWILPSGHKRWTEATPGETGVPAWATLTGYHAVIDADRSGAKLSKPDPRQVIRGAISDNAATTIRVSLPVPKWIRERRITALGDLVGRHGWIMRTTGYDWSRAFIERPEGPMWSYGKVKASGAGTITSDRPIQHAAGAVGREVIYMPTSGILQRGTVTAVDTSTNTLTFTGTTDAAVVAASFFVTPAGAFWTWRGDDPTPLGPGLQCAWAGLPTTYYAHATGKFSDGVTTVSVPRLKYPVSYGQTLDACPIDPEQWDVRASAETLGRDPDTFVPEDNVCGAGDVLLMEKFYRCYRAIWSTWLWVCESYCPRFIYDSANPAYIADFTISTALAEAGVNPISGSTGSVVGGGGGPSGTIACVLDVPHTPVNLWWTICDATGKPMVQGWTANYDGATLSGGPFTPGVHEGKTVVASLGPRRLVEREFARLLPGIGFLPSVDGDPAAAQAVSETYPGTWYTDPASVFYLMSDVDGIVTSSGLARHAIDDGHIARWVGHRTYDPGLPIPLPADVPDPLAEYYNHLAVSRRTPAVQARIDASKRGTLTAVSSNGLRLTDSTKDWLSVDFYAASNGYTHTGTFASGSTSIGVDPTKAGSALWAAARFPGFSSPLRGFPIEIKMSGTDFDDPAALIEKRFISTCIPSTGQLRFDQFGADPLPSSAAGKDYRIPEPMVLNRWAGMKVRLRNTAGDVATTVINFNDGDTLSVQDPGITIDVGTTYEIDPDGLRLGDVVRRVSGAWVTTADAGADARFGGATFRKDASQNQADVIIEYGLPLPTDRSTQSLAWHQELYDFANAVTDIIGPDPTWHGYADDDVPENNFNGFDGEVYTETRGALHDLFSHLETPVKDHVLGVTWPSGDGLAQDPSALPSSSISHIIDEEFATCTGIQKSYAYLQIEPYTLPEFFPIGYGVKAYVWASIGGDPGPDPGTTVVVGTHAPLADRAVTFYDTSLGLPFREWQVVGSGSAGTRIKVGGSISTPPDWGEVLSEADINSDDHPSGTLATNSVQGACAVARRAEVCRMAFKFGPP